MNITDFLLILLFIVAGAAIWLLHARPVYPTYNPMELDRMSCERMRKQGWPEEHIEEFMKATGGTYHPPQEN